MRITVRGKNIEVTEALRQYVEKRLGKLERFANYLGEAQVVLSLERENHKVEVTINMNGMILRGEEATHDMYAAIDLVVDKLERQIERYKGKWLRRRVEGSAAPSTPYLEPAGKGEEEEFRVVKVKRFAWKPMSIKEAILQMNLLGHNFFVFTNAETEQVNVVYRRKDGNYGLIEPEV
ncbi:sigma 54 modulation protein/ribosomal protein S30EA [Ammonifex degensii KC4]|uniref:Ribosome hibernation promoting factor n=1 Tax=Ammonifex degensii (strain DSM 10501 / KC4) TaxID=429009 RepID=C9RBI8_AMMDK|nr:ribosome-associated translation inhibitor RaiA [Ammonifex degensii]ACX51615.1 sigma 54 modulation protein/ribosomal protein S30EA [Ammonifex degensii KC4]